VEEIRPLATQSGMIIELETGRRLPEVNADAERIRQVVMNLVNNAMKYARDGKKITIRTAGQPDVVTVEIRDYGPGIPPEVKENLFEPGYQVAYREASTGGLGIGLSLCKMLVELHGGTIWVESIPGKGAGFFFTVPVTPAKNKT
jgi:signal transduction histidine kinase